MAKEYLANYHSIEAWGINSGNLNDPFLLSDILEDVANDKSGQGLLPNQFTPHGVTAIKLSERGIFTGHQWPEYNYGFYTCYSRDPQALGTMKRLIREKLNPKKIGSERPVINHLVTRSIIPAENFQNDPFLLLKTGHLVAERGQLKSFSQKPTYLIYPDLHMAVVGLEASHLSMELKFIGKGDVAEATVDVVTCEENRSLQPVNKAIQKLLNPIISLPPYLKHYPEGIVKNDHQTHISGVGPSELLVRQVPVKKLHYTYNYKKIS